jgi:hypothetical protein
LATAASLSRYLAMASLSALVEVCPGSADHREK